MSAEEPVPYMGQDYNALLAQLEESGEKFVDDLEDAHMTLCQTYNGQDVEWIRCTKLPCCTDDNGDVAKSRKEYTGEDGEWKNVNFESEYDKTEHMSTLMDACLG